MTHSTVCPTAERLHQFDLGLLDAADAETVERHLADCPTCRRQVENANPADSVVLALRQATSALAEPPPVVEQLMARVRAWPVCGLPPSTVVGRGSTDTVDPKSMPLPERIGPYRSVGVLGRGGMGTVYLAEDSRLPRRVALKVLLEERGAHPDYRERFQREAAALARLRHPNIVQIHEVGQWEGRLFLALEYVEGGSLADRLAGAPQPLPESVRLVETLAEAVQYAHAQGVTHRDLKPANVLIAEGTDKLAIPKIADFGLARHRDEEGLTQTGDLLGTPGYLAPEATRGERAALGPAVDVYALGAILYELLTGRPPFRGATVLDTLEQARTLDPVPPRRLRPDVTRDLETICLVCLRKEPNRRYATAAALAEDLNRFRTGRPVLARPTGRLEKVVKWARRRPALASLVAVSGLALTLLVAGAVVYERRLQRALLRAETNRTHAVANYRAARETLEKMLKRLNDRRRADLPGVGELRREQQEDALAFLLQVADQRGDDPEVRRDVATAYYVAGRLQKDLGRDDEAKANLERARALWTALAAEQPQAREPRHQLAETLHALGSFRGSVDELGPLLRQALALLEALAEEAPDVADYRAGQGLSHHLLGCVAFNNRDFEGAKVHFHAAEVLRERLLEERPDDRGRRSQLANTQVNLSVLYQQSKTKDAAAAAAYYAKARIHLERLVEDDPQDLANSGALAALRVNWANNLLFEKRYDEVIADMKQNLALLTPFLEREPTHAGVRYNLLLTHGLWANALEQQGRHAEEVPHRRRVFELDSVEGKEHSHAYLAWTLARAGDHAAAVAEAEKIAEVKNPKLDFYLAQTCALAAEKVRTDATLAAGERGLKAEGYQAAAVRFLGRLKARDALKWPQWKKDIVEDVHLKTLRDREDYRRAVAEP